MTRYFLALLMSVVMLLNGCGARVRRTPPHFPHPVHLRFDGPGADPCDTQDALTFVWLYMCAYYGICMAPCTSPE